MDQPVREHSFALAALERQNAHLLKVLSQVRTAIDPSIATTGANLDAANYALANVFGPLGNEQGRFCVPRDHVWLSASDIPSIPQTLSSGRWCSVCGKVENR